MTSHDPAAPPVGADVGPDGRPRWVGALPDRVGASVGVASVVAGGLVAAVTDPLHLGKGSWLAAYLVLVSGVAQVVVSAQAGWLRTSPGRPGLGWWRLVAWNAGNALVVAGALAGVPVLTDVGGAVLLGALVLAWVGTGGSPLPRHALVLRVIYALLVVSIPIGLVLTQLRS